MSKIGYNPVAKIVVIGVGGGGNNSVKELLNKRLDGIEYVVANTDKQVLQQFEEDVILQLGDQRGIGAGANPEVGRQAALTSADEIKAKLKGADLVILTAGMGGGTGTGASPVIAKIAKECNALVMAIVTTPFSFEGIKRKKIAEEGLKELIQNVDSYVVISNNKLMEQYGDIDFNSAFTCVDNVLKQAIRTITDIIAVPGIINLDFADLETIIKNSGEAVIGIGTSSGTDRAIKAITAAISSPILETSVRGASDAIVYFEVPSSANLNEINKAVNQMQEYIGEKTNIIFGITKTHSEEREKMGEIAVSVIATGLKKNAAKGTEKIQREVSDIIKNGHNLHLEDERTREILINSPFTPSNFSNQSQNNFNDDELADIVRK
ncbi:cell division protein FtsZ [Metamycoplasma subdolum]|uniref:Cell division protein FtsZ n=1 Tax=Metamycoplasma subdolum TaxID=92407 RepID=A0A3L9ZYL3_9BACT|nr:cell division protein FtsZ [Metamycoplasma subdolum]RMA77536.1 cell division protein FtsZ [Metamycoplasma subdolum]WPB50728.1 cell division protein FtsZ [Metamycoplasma subdolum]